MSMQGVNNHTAVYVSYNDLYHHLQGRQSWESCGAQDA